MHAPFSVLFAAGAFAGLLALGIVPKPAEAPAEAASLTALCRRECKDTIATCVSSTGRRRIVCKKKILGLCNAEGLHVCAPPESNDITALFSGPACTVQADTFVQESDPDKNYGTRSLLEVDASPTQRTFIRVLVSGVGSGQQVTSARIRLQVTSDDQSDSGGRIHHQPGCGWYESGSGGITWNHQPGFSLAVLDSNGAVGHEQPVQFTVTPVVPGNGTYCFVIDSLSSNGISYNSREASSGRPTCVVEVSSITTTTTPTSTTSTTAPVTTTTSRTTTTTSATTTSSTTIATSTTITISTTIATSTTTITTTTSTTTTVRFVDNGDGTVTDNQTCLQWEKKDGDDGVQNLSDPHDVDNLYTWTATTGGTAPDGTAFTTFLATLNGGVTGVGNCVSSDGNTQTGGFANRCDWRLPTVAELKTILNLPCGFFPPCTYPIFAPNASTISTTYWSSITFNIGLTFAWYVDTTFSGTAGANPKTDNFPVRAVRGGS